MFSTKSDFVKLFEAKPSVASSLEKYIKAKSKLLKTELTAKY